MAAHVSPFAGSWYPRQKRKLTALLDDAFDRSAARTGSFVLPGVLALVVPHAAPHYSGTVAAGAYRHLRSAQPERVFVLGFNHRRGSRIIEIPDLEAYASPLGEIAVDRSAVSALGAVAPFRIVDEDTVCDHSVEMQLPYLQRAAPEAAIVPLFVGALDEEDRTLAAEALARAWRPGDVLIASSDLTHYGRDFRYVPFPNDSLVAENLRWLDHSLIDLAGSLDAGLFLDGAREAASTACGVHPIALLLRTLSLLDGDDTYQQELDYQTSGEITEDFRSSVSYGALGYFRRRSFELAEEEWRPLLVSAEKSVEHLRRTGARREIPPPNLAGLARRAAVFVTLTSGGELIGCLGRLACDEPLRQSVPSLTLAAALDDPRRSRRAALPNRIEVELSILTPMKLVLGAEAIRIGADGVCLRTENRRALLLPQALDRAWTANDLLAAILRKAEWSGVHRSDPYQLFRFGAQVVGGR